MNKFWLAVLFCMLCTVSNGFAETIEGKVISVDSSGKKIEIESDKGASKIAYTGSTRWPSGIHDPKDLVGKKVSIHKDDLMEEAIHVSEL